MAKVQTSDGEINLDVGDTYTDSNGNVYYKTLYGLEVTKQENPPPPVPTSRNYTPPNNQFTDYTGRTVCADDKCQTRVKERVQAYNQGSGPPPIFMSQLQQRLVNERTVGNKSALQNARVSSNQVQASNIANSGYANQLASDYMRENPYLDYDTALAIAISRIAEDQAYYGVSNNLNRNIDPNFRRASERADTMSLALGTSNKIENNPTLNDVPSNQFFFSPNPDGTFNVIDREGRVYNATASEITALQEMNTSATPNTTLRSNYNAIANARANQQTNNNYYKEQADYNKYLSAQQQLEAQRIKREIEKQKLQKVIEERKKAEAEAKGTTVTPSLPKLVPLN